MIEDVSFYVLTVAVIAVPFAYILGLAVSRGWHRGKRESVACMVKEATNRDED